MNFKIRAIIIGAVALLVLIIAVFIWRFFNPPAQPPDETPSPVSGTLPEITTDKREEKGLTTLKKFSDKAIFDFWIIKDTNEVFYITDDGKVYRAKKDIDEEVSTESFASISSVEAFGTGVRALVSFERNGQQQWGIFDVYDRAWKPLQEGVITATWGKTENSVYALLKESNSISLKELDISKGAPIAKNLITNINIDDVSLSYLGKDTLLIKEKSSSMIESSIYALNLKSLTLKTFLGPEYGLITKEIQNSPFFLSFATHRGFRIHTSTEDPSRIAPTFFTTLPEKCTISASTTLCFVPDEKSVENATLPDDLLQQSIQTTDTLYSLNLTDQVGSALVRTGTEVLNAINAKGIESVSDKIYTKNNYDSLLYELTLGKSILNQLKTLPTTSKLIPENSATTTPTSTKKQP